MKSSKALFLLWICFGLTPSLAQQITYLEYYVNTDPGHGLATSVAISAAEHIENVSIEYPVNTLADGLYRMYFRARDNEGKWSMTAHHPFMKVTPVVPPTPAMPDINRIEYFVDSDPGYGLATPVSITPGESIGNISVVLSMAGLNDGPHRMYMRARDTEGVWSIVYSHTFLKITPVVPPVIPIPQIVKAEYFINTDPGYGQGTNIPVGTNELTAAVNITGLSLGTHTVYVRVQDSNGKWSMVNRQNIVIANHSLLVDNVPLSFCRNTVFTLPYQAQGAFGAANVFTAQLSDSNGNFDYPTIIGSRTATTSGSISASIPMGLAVGKGYKLRVVSSNPTLIGEVDVAEFEITEECPAPCSTSVVLVNPINNSSSGNLTVEAKEITGKITANNKYSGSAKVTFKAAVIELNPGFTADSGTVFRAEIGGCQ